MLADGPTYKMFFLQDEANFMMCDWKTVLTPAAFGRMRFSPSRPELYTWDSGKSSAIGE